MVSGKISGTVLGRYRLEEVAGTGAMGVVARARDQVLDRTVAIKLLKDEFASDAETVERFRREALVAASLQHPGIAQVFDFGQENGRSFIVMEFLDGRDLHSLLSSAKRFSVAVATEITARAAEALDHAHRAGTVHRDVKPSNIFITRSQQVKVTDFGIARAADRAPITKSGTVVGTFQYLSPEQALGDSVGPASDIYSLGCVLFETLTGRPPFEGDSLPALSMAHVSQPPPSARVANPSVPEKLDAVVLKCLAKDPNDRFASGAEMADALRGASPESGKAVSEEISALLAAPGRSEAQPGAKTAVSTDRLDATRVLEPETPPDTPGPEPETPRDTRVLKEEAPRDHINRGRLRLMRPLLAIVVLAAAILALVLLANRGDRSQVTVPRWVGEDLDVAMQEAERLDLRIDPEGENSSLPPDEILRQDPKEGERVSRGTVVTLYVSSGPEMVVVPPVVGLKLEEAEEQLGSYGFVPEVVGDSEERDPEVVSQDPGPGTSKPRGSTVRLTISSKEGKGRDKGDD